MTKEEFRKRKWGAGMVIKYVDSDENQTTELVSDVVSVDFEEDRIGVYLPITGDLVYLRCEQCEVIVELPEKK